MAQFQYSNGVTHKKKKRKKKNRQVNFLNKQKRRRIVHTYSYSYTALEDFFFFCKFFRLVFFFFLECFSIFFFSSFFTFLLPSSLLMGCKCFMYLAVPTRQRVYIIAVPSDCDIGTKRFCLFCPPPVPKALFPDQLEFS